MGGGGDGRGGVDEQVDDDVSSEARQQ